MAVSAKSSEPSVRCDWELHEVQVRTPVTMIRMVFGVYFRKSSAVASAEYSRTLTSRRKAEKWGEKEEEEGEISAHCFLVFMSLQYLTDFPSMLVRYSFVHSQFPVTIFFSCTVSLTPMKRAEGRNARFFSLARVTL